MQRFHVSSRAYCVIQDGQVSRPAVGEVIVARLNERWIISYSSCRKVKYENAPFHQLHHTRTFMHSLLSRPAFMDTCSGVLECTVIATPFELIKYRPRTLPHRCLPTCPVMKGDISTLPNWTGQAMPNVLPPPYLHTFNMIPITMITLAYYFKHK